jgi:hypothetical protein
MWGTRGVVVALAEQQVPRLALLARDDNDFFEEEQYVVFLMERIRRRL